MKKDVAQVKDGDYMKKRCVSSPYIDKYSLLINVEMENDFIISPDLLTSHTDTNTTKKIF